MLLFFKKIIIATLPVLVVFVFPLFVDVMSGEFVMMQTVISKQLTNKDVIYGPAYSDETIYLKTEMVKKVNPSVLAIGNSKIFTLRTGFFDKGVTFYNAGGTAANISSFRKFLEVTNTKPKYLIMIVEPLHFDPTLTVGTSTLDGKKYQQVSLVTKVSSILMRSWTGVYIDYVQKKFTLEELLHKNSYPEMLGLSARVTGSGFRNDGSYHYGKQYESKELKKERLDKAVAFIGNREWLEGKESFSTPALTELDDFLAYCKEKNIYVIGYIPPTPKVIEDAYRKYPKYEYVFHTYEKTLPLFQKYDFELYDFFSMKQLGASDEETIDEYHTTEKVMLRVMIKMSDKGKTLSYVTTKASLQKLLNSIKDQNDVLR